MKIWILIAITVINLLSIAALVLIDREVRYLMGSHIHILGEENRELVESGMIKSFRLSYIVIICLLIMGSYLFYFSSL